VRDVAYLLVHRRCPWGLRQLLCVGSMTKRLTVRTFDRVLDALDLDAVLRKAGIDSKVVTKHAVQINPDQVQEAKAAVQCERSRRKAAA
jgi:hypothetical protein